MTVWPKAILVEKLAHSAASTGNRTHDHYGESQKHYQPHNGDRSIYMSIFPVPLTPTIRGLADTADTEVHRRTSEIK